MSCEYCNGEECSCYIGIDLSHEFYNKRTSKTLTFFVYRSRLKDAEIEAKRLETDNPNNRYIPICRYHLKNRLLDGYRVNGLIGRIETADDERYLKSMITD